LRVAPRADEPAREPGAPADRRDGEGAGARPGGKGARGRRVGSGHDDLLSAADCRMARCPRREPKEGAPKVQPERLSQVGSALSADTAAPSPLGPTLPSARI